MGNCAEPGGRAAAEAAGVRGDQAPHPERTDEGGRCPASTRELSKALNIARSTAVEAYEMLICEGFVLSGQGAPTRVADGLCIEAPAPRQSPAPAPKPAWKADFRTGRPDLRQFPQFLWRQCMRGAPEELPVEQYGYTGPEGLPALREEIAAWLMRSRGLAVRPDDVFITAGATHALHLPPFEQAALALFLRARKLEGHCIEKGAHRDKLLLGYGHLEPGEIAAAVRFLAESMRELRPAD